MALFRHCPTCGSDCFRPSSPKSCRCEACGFELFMNASSANAALIVCEGRLLVVRRQNEPARGTLDLPGGFADMGETAEEGVCREVMEETGLRVTRADYLFSLPNLYIYSGLTLPTLDLFFRCEVADAGDLRAADDAAEALWVPLADVCPEAFGLDSIRRGVARFLQLSSPQPYRP